MDIKNIRMTLATAVVLVINTGGLIWGAAKITAMVEKGNDTAARTERKVDAMDQDNKLWKSKIEADLSDLKVRNAILEAKVKDIELKNWGR